jgi:hypothetical protein
MNVEHSKPWIWSLCCAGALLGVMSACSDSNEPSTTTPALSAAGSNSGTAAAGDDASVCQSALFCDDFEAFALDQPPAGAWVSNQNNGSVQVVADRSFRGQQAVKATTLATAVTGSTYKSALIGLSQAPVVPVPEQRFYGRMMFYLESAPAASVHWTFIDGTGDVPGQDYSATYRYGGQLPVTDGTTFVGSQLMANYDTTDFYGTPPVGPQTDCYQHAARQVVPVGTWSCAEWSFDGQNSQMRFWLDGTEITGLAIDGTGEGCVAQPADYTWVAPSFSRLDVGWESYQADEERTIWIDDVVISQTQVGCPAPRP